MPFDPTDPRYASPLAAMAQDRMSGMLNQPQMKVFADAPQDQGTKAGSPILPGQMQLNRTMGMALGGPVSDELAGIKDTIRQEFLARGLDFDKFVSNPAVMDEVGKSIASQGKNGDTILAHINPEEADVLKEMGGSGTLNPATGLPQFDNPSMGAYDAPSSSSVSPGLSGFGGGSSSPSGVSGGGFSSPTSGGGGGGYSSIGGGSYTSRTGGDGGGSLAAGRAADRDSVAGYSASPQTTLSPLGAGGGSVSMGQAQPQANEAIGSVPSFAGIDPMSGLPIGGASNISGLAQLATAPDLAQTIAPVTRGIGPIDTAASQVPLSDIEFADAAGPYGFSNINAGVAPNAVAPGGISNYAAAPQQPGYTDTGITAMRMAAGLEGRPGTIDRKTGIGYGTEFYLNQLGELAPVAQTPGSTILNRMIDEGYSPAFDIYGVGRTNLEQAMLQAGADGALTAAPGRSMHNFGLAMDVENLPDQGYRDLARIAREEGWGWGTMKDPAHVQMAPWGAGAVQTARRLGAEPFTGPATTASLFTPAAKEQNALTSALNTVSNIAGELFGVKSAEAAVVGPQETMVSNPEADMFYEMQRERFADQYGPFMSSDGTGVAPAQPGSFGPSPEIIDIPLREINRQFVSPEFVASRTPEAQVAGSGVFPSYEQAGIKYPERAPSAGVLAPAPRPVQIAAPPTPLDRFGAPQEMATYGAEQAYPSYPRMGVDAFGPLGPMNMAELTATESGQQPVTQAEAVSPPVVGSDLAEYMGTTPQGNYLFSALDLANKTVPNAYTVNPDSVVQQVRAKYPGLSFVNYGADTPENNAAMAKDIIGGLGEYGLSFSGNRLTGDINQPAVQEMLNTAGIKEGTFVPVTQTTATTDWSQPAAGPYQSVSYGAGPMSFADLTPLGATQPAAQPAGLSSFESALGSLPVTTKTPAYAEPRIAPLTKPISTEQAKQDVGYYDKPLEAGETVRENFNEAFADAAANGLKEFSWKNPKTGEVGRYKVAFAQGGMAKSPLASMGKR